MAENFSILFRIDRVINHQSDIELLRSEMEKAVDACDCGIKGVVLCQIFDTGSGYANIEGKFIDHDTANKVIALIKG